MRTLEVAYDWFSPPLMPAIASAAVIIIGLVLIGYSLKSSNSQIEINPTRQLIFTAVFYILFLFVSISFFDFYTPIDNRTLSPIYPLIIAALAYSIRLRPPMLQPIGLASLALLIILSLLGAGSILSSTSRLSQTGSGYLSNTFRAQDVLQYMAKIQSPKIYSNSRETIDFYFDRDSLAMPSTFNPSDNRINPSSEASYRELISEIRDGNAVLVYFNRFSWRRYYPPLQYFENEADLPVLFHGQSGVIFGKNSATISIPAN